MKQEQILKKAIEKAIKNGYEPDGILGAVLRGEIGVGLNPNIYVHLANTKQYFLHIFDHSFAKAFFGKGNKGAGDPNKWSWQFHLQQLVISTNRLAYLGKFLEK